MDEPTAGVDPRLAANQGFDPNSKPRQTVLLTSHLLEQVEDICDRIGIMFGGRWFVRPASDLVTVEGGRVNRQTLPPILKKVEALASASGAKLLETRKARLSLERVFLEATRSER
jgi:ABC-2 type transport system ATP-binding protein